MAQSWRLWVETLLGGRFYFSWALYSTFKAVGVQTAVRESYMLLSVPCWVMARSTASMKWEGHFDVASLVQDFSTQGLVENWYRKDIFTIRIIMSIGSSCSLRGLCSLFFFSSICSLTLQSYCSTVRQWNVFVADLNNIKVIFDTNTAKRQG